MMAAMSPLVFISTYCTFGRLLICIQFADIELMEKYLWLIYAFPGMLFLNFPETVLNILFPHIRVISLATWRSSLCLGDCDTHKEARSLFMRLWDIQVTSVPIFIQEQDIQNKVNWKRSTRFSRLEELATDQITSIFLLYTQEYMAYTAAKLD